MYFLISAKLCTVISTVTSTVKYWNAKLKKSFSMYNTDIIDFCS